MVLYSNINFKFRRGKYTIISEKTINNLNASIEKTHNNL